MKNKIREEVDEIVDEIERFEMMGKGFTREEIEYIFSIINEIKIKKARGIFKK